MRDDEAKVSAPRDYRPIETLAPQTWTVQANLSQEPANISIQTGGTDAAGIHYYNLSIGTDLESGRTNIGAAYGYTKLRFPIRLALARTIFERGGYRIDGVNKSFTEQDWSGTISSSNLPRSRPATPSASRSPGWSTPGTKLNNRRPPLSWSSWASDFAST